MAELDRMLEANRAFAEGFAEGGRPAAPARGVAILTCMDARLDPVAALGLAPGDAHVLRNAGGRASDDAIRSLILSSRLLGVREVAVIHHTRCGMQADSDAALHARLAGEAGVDARDVPLLTFADLEQSVRDDVERILASPHLDEALVVAGLVYDVDSGRLETVVPARVRGR